MIAAAFALLLIASYVASTGYFKSAPKSSVSEAILARDCAMAVKANHMPH